MLNARRNLCLFLGLSLTVVLTSTSLAQPGGPGGRRGGPGGGRGGFGGMSGNPLWMLRDEQIRKELEIVGDQQAELDAISERIRNEMRKRFEGMRDLSQEERRAKWQEMQEEMREQGAKIAEEVDKVLLPHQRDRLKQIALQMRLQRQGASGALLDSRTVEALGITEAQKEELIKLRGELEVEMREKIEKIREEAKEKLLGVLTGEQRAKLEELTGERFERQPREPRGE
jgi:Spy/CpxP family protein refolding chaperone